LPDIVVSRAKEILSTLEQGDCAPLPTSEYPVMETESLENKLLIKNPELESSQPASKAKKVKADPSQLELF
jgi:hypothetical protein